MFIRDHHLYCLEDKRTLGYSQKMCQTNSYFTFTPQKLSDPGNYFKGNYCYRPYKQDQLALMHVFGYFLFIKWNTSYRWHNRVIYSFLIISAIRVKFLAYCNESFNRLHPFSSDLLVEHMRNLRGVSTYCDAKHGDSYGPRGASNW